MAPMKTERRFLTESGTEVFTGNELLVKGALEADGGTHLLGGYPGSPIAGYFDSITTLKDVLHEKGVRAVINNNEALAAAMLNGTQTLPVRAMIVMCERWLCAPRSEISFEQGHRLCTGTTTFISKRGRPRSISPTKVTS